MKDKIHDAVKDIKRQFNVLEEVYPKLEPQWARKGVITVLGWNTKVLPKTLGLPPFDLTALDDEIEEEAASALSPCAGNEVIYFGVAPWTSFSDPQLFQPQLPPAMIVWWFPQR